MTGHHELDCKFLKTDLVPYEEQWRGVTHTGMKCDLCGITFETWVTHQIRQLLGLARTNI